MPFPARNTLAVIGAGPVGLEAAVAALDRGFDVQVYEQGEVGSHPIAWGHVTMFTPWRAGLGPRGRAHLEAAGWPAPDLDAFPTGLELAERYLQPLAGLPELKDRVHQHVQVVRAGRHGLLAGEGGEARRERPFRLLLRDPGGRESFVHAFSLIDATGVYAHPDRAGTGGVPARNELYLRPQLAYHVEDVLGLARERYEGKRTLVFGSGTYATITVLDLARLAEQVPGTSAVWVTREPAAALFPRLADDPLPGRRALLERARALAAGAHPQVAHLGGAEIEGFEFNSATHRYRVMLALGDQPYVEEVDRVVINAGFSADTSLCRLLQPGEPQFHVLGHKSRGVLAGGGGDPGFLLADGYRQVEEAVARLAQEVNG